MNRDKTTQMDQSNYQPLFALKFDGVQKTLVYVLMRLFHRQPKQGNFNSNPERNRVIKLSHTLFLLDLVTNHSGISNSEINKTATVSGRIYRKE